MNMDPPNPQDEFPGFFIPENDEEWQLVDSSLPPVTPCSEAEISHTVQITLRHPQFERARPKMTYRLKNPPRKASPTKAYTRLSPSLKALLAILLITNVTSLALSLKNSVTHSSFAVSKESHDHLHDLEEQEKAAQLRRAARNSLKAGPLAAIDGHCSVTADMPNISVYLRDFELRTALELISEKIDKNLIVSPSVRGKISANLESVPWRSAIENLIKSVGDYSLVEEGEILRVVPTVEIESKLVTTTIPYGREKGKEPDLSAIRALTKIVDSTRSPNDFIEFHKETGLLIIRASYSTTQEILETINAIQEPKQVKTPLPKPVEGTKHRR